MGAFVGQMLSVKVGSVRAMQGVLERVYVCPHNQSTPSAMLTMSVRTRLVLDLRRLMVLPRHVVLVENRDFTLGITIVWICQMVVSVGQTHNAKVKFVRVMRVGPKRVYVSPQNLSMPVVMTIVNVRTILALDPLPLKMPPKCVVLVENLDCMRDIITV
jgi:hypothetical protein